MRADPGSLYIQVMRPLCWVGLLQEIAPRRIGSAEQVFVKTRSGVQRCD